MWHFIQFEFNFDKKSIFKFLAKKKKTLFYFIFLQFIIRNTQLYLYNLAIINKKCLIFVDNYIYIIKNNYINIFFYI